MYNFVYNYSIFRSQVFQHFVGLLLKTLECHDIGVCCADGTLLVLEADTEQKAALLSKWIFMLDWSHVLFKDTGVSGITEPNSLIRTKLTPDSLQRHFLESFSFLHQRFWIPIEQTWTFSSKSISSQSLAGSWDALRDLLAVAVWE